MKNWTREQLETRLWLSAAFFAFLMVVGSTVHMSEALSWANRDGMAFFLACGVVGLQVALVSLSLVNKHEERAQVKVAIRIAMLLLFILEVSANIAVGGSLASDRLPETVAAFFGLSQDAAVRLAGLLYAGFIPMLNLILIFALIETQSRWLPESLSAQLPQDGVLHFAAEEPLANSAQNDGQNASGW